MYAYMHVRKQTGFPRWATPDSTLAGETPTLQGLQALQHLLLMGLQELPHALVIRLHKVADTGAGHIHTLHHRLHQRPLW